MIKYKLCKFPILFILGLLTIFHVAYTLGENTEAVKTRRYDDAQLWRIFNTSHTLPAILEKEFGANIWSHNPNFLDISVEKNFVTSAKEFLKKYNLVPEILNTNIQNLFDQEINNATKRSSRATRAMSWQDYQDLPTIYAYLQGLTVQYPNLCSLINIGKTAEGRNLFVLRITENLNNKKIWIDGGIHAREWISPASVTFIIKSLLANWSQQPLYIKQKTWLIMPVMNPDGYVYSRQVNRLWRKNRAINTGSSCRGVDLNRNFDIGWNAGGSSTDRCSDVFRGTAPASELETKAVVKFLTEQKYNLAAYLTYHSYSQVIVYPFGYKAAIVSNGAELQRVGQLAAQRIQTKTGKVYDTSVTYKYFGILGGGSDDWTRAALGTPYVYTMELRDRGQYGFVLPPAQILGTGEEAYTFAITVAEAI